MATVFVECEYTAGDQGREAVYSDAMLKFTRKTRRCHDGEEGVVDTKQSLKDHTLVSLGCIPH